MYMFCFVAGVMGLQLFLKLITFHVFTLLYTAVNNKK